MMPFGTLHTGKRGCKLLSRKTCSYMEPSHQLATCLANARVTGGNDNMH